MDREKLIASASGRIDADLVIKNVNVVDVFGGKIMRGDVAVCGGKFCGVGNYKGKTEIDGSGKYLMPSFFDAHLHFESAMMSPSEYLPIAAARGVTSYMADPHEIANVCGEDGIKFICDSVRGLPLKVHIKMPSCVPAAPLDSSGAVLDASDCKRLIEKYDLFGLGEMMNYPGVIGCDADVMGKLDCSAHTDGHIPSLSGEQLNGYISAGIYNDHECGSSEEVDEKISKGMYVMLREGSQTRNLRANVKCVNSGNLRRFVFCTDDRNVEDLMQYGSVQNCVRIAVEEGLDPIAAITIASLNAYECFGIKNHGAIAPGYAADFIIASDLSAQHIERVFCDGAEVARDGKALFTPKKVDLSKVKNTVHIGKITASDLALDFQPHMPVMQVYPNTVVTDHADCTTADGLNLMACIERHKGTGNIGKCYVRGFDLKGGAVAQTIGHDAHNITVLGDNTNDMAVAVNALGGDGGLAIAQNGKVIGFLPLEIAGLMTDKPAAQLLSARQDLLSKLESMDYDHNIEPFMLLSFLSLIVIPDLKLNDHGLFSVSKWEYLK